MVIRRLINAAHDALGQALDNLTRDSDLDTDARFEDHAADLFERFRIDNSPRGRGLSSRLHNRPMPWRVADAIDQDAAHVRREDI